MDNEVTNNMTKYPTTGIRCMVQPNNFASQIPSEIMIKSANACIEVDKAYARSQIRKEELAYKASLKYTRYSPAYDSEGISLYVISNFDDRIISKMTIFKCRIVQVRRFERSDLRGGMFQLILFIPREGRNKTSPLYPDSFLESANRLKRTILCEYEEPQSYSASKVAWETVWVEVKKHYDGAEIVKLPDKVGWFINDGRSRYADARRSEFFMDDYFKLRYMSDVRKELLEHSFQEVPVCTEVGVLLLIRLLALFSSFYCCNVLKAVGVLLYGDNSVEIACKLLSVCDPVTILNIDADRIEQIDGTIGATKDNAIIMSSSIENRSTRNRLDRVMSWLDCGYASGKRIRAPIVICTSCMNVKFIAKDMLILSTNAISTVQCENAYNQLQSFLVDIIETSGNYFADMLGREKNQVSDCNSIASLFVDIAADIVALLETKKVEEDSDIVKLLRTGVDAIIRQSQHSEERLCEQFREIVQELVAKGEIKCIHKDQWEAEELHSIIYDADGYYFTYECIRYICDLASMDYGSYVHIKRMLYQNDFIKIYRSKRGLSQEFLVDLFVGSSPGKKKKISVLAVKSCYWDSLGGIHLFERSF